jgi:hypothetical protein
MSRRDAHLLACNANPLIYPPTRFANKTRALIWHSVEPPRLGWLGGQMPMNLFLERVRRPYSRFHPHLTEANAEAEYDYAVGFSPSPAIPVSQLVHKAHGY